MARRGKAEQLPLRRRRLLHPGTELRLDGLGGPAYDAQPLPSGRRVGDELRQPPGVGAERRAAMERAHAVDEQRAGRHHHLHLVVVQRWPLLPRVVGRPEDPLRVVATRTHCGWRMVLRDVRVVEQVGRLPVRRIVRRIGQRVVAVVAVHRLVLIGGVALALEAQMRLLARHLAAAGETLREGEQRRMRGDGVEVAAGVGEAVGQLVHGPRSGRQRLRRLRRTGILAELHPAGQDLAPLGQGAGQFVGG